MSRNYIDIYKIQKKDSENQAKKPESSKSDFRGVDDSKKPSRVFNIILIVLLILILTAAGLVFGYYYGKNKGINIGYQQAKSESEKTDSKEKETTKKAEESGQSNEKEYTVESGDTLFSIGLKFDLPWTEIAEVNGLTEESIIVEGQKLKIPTVQGASTENGAKEYEINQADQEKYQEDTDSGKNIWRLDPVEVAKKLVPDAFGITSSDGFNLISKNTSVGEAEVEINHKGQLFTAKLIQPVEKGDDGIWTVQSVKSQ